jgi:lipoate---protein ligase
MKNTWRYIDENDVSASYGLAVDEFLMQSHQTGNKNQASLRLYNYRDYSALCGRFQNIHAEIDIEACRKNNFGFSRRLTGGGAIIMGSEQLGVCVATGSNSFDWNHIRELYEMFSGPLILALKSFGINAQFRSKNDLEVNGKKIAGLGVYISPGGTIQFHASLLSGLNINDMLKVLNIPIRKYDDERKIKGIEQRLTTITRESGMEVAMHVLKERILESYAKAFDIDFDEQALTGQEIASVSVIEQQRYLDDTWVFQYSPQEDMTGMSLKRTVDGLLRTYIGLKGETIKSVLITGDFMDQPEVFGRIESRLKWSALDKENIEKIIASEMQTENGYHGKINVQQLTDAIWIAAQRAIAATKYTYSGSCYYPKMEKTLSN